MNGEVHGVLVDPDGARALLGLLRAGRAYTRANGIMLRPLTVSLLAALERTATGSADVGFEDSWMTTREAATVLDRGVRAVVAMLDRGTLVGEKLGRSWLVSGESVHAERVAQERLRNATERDGTSSDVGVA